MASSSFTPQTNPLTGHAYLAQWHIYQARSSELPVAHRAKDLIRELGQNQVLILIGQTGSGKTTQFPKAVLLHDREVQQNNGPMMAITHPRRLAADQV